MHVSKRGGTSTYGQLLLGVLGGAVLATGIFIAGGEFKRRGWTEPTPVTMLLASLERGFKFAERQKGNRKHLDIGCHRARKTKSARVPNRTAVACDAQATVARLSVGGTTRATAELVIPSRHSPVMSNNSCVLIASGSIG
jgi:hypothetical protein